MDKVWIVAAHPCRNSKQYSYTVHFVRVTKWLTVASAVKGPFNLENYSLKMWASQHEPGSVCISRTQCLCITQLKTSKWRVCEILFRETQRRHSASKLLLGTHILYLSVPVSVCYQPGCAPVCVCVCGYVFLKQQERTFFHLTHGSTGLYLCWCSTLLIATVILTGDAVVGKGK